MRVSFLLLFSVLLTFSCKKDADTPPHQNTFSATVEGPTESNFVPSTIEVFRFGYTASGPGYVTIDANEGSGRRLFLYMLDYDGTKSTFNFLNGNQSSSTGSFCLKDCGYIYGTSTYYSDSGAINIGSFDKTTYKTGEVITGTFQFEASDSTGKLSIRNGHFSVLVPN